MISILPHVITAVFSIAATLLIIRSQLRWTERKAAEADKHSRGIAYGLTMMVQNFKTEPNLLDTYKTDKPFDYGVREGVKIYKQGVRAFEREAKK